jgi:actin related protein 2/3 complex subunit 2
MILLEVYNRIVEQAIRSQIEAPDGKREALEIQCADFDGVLYHISTDKDNNAVNLSLQWGCADQLLKQGARDDLQQIYGSYLQSTPEANYQVTLRLNLGSLPSGKEAEELPQKFAMLKRHLFATAFKRAFASVTSGSNSPIAIDYRVGSETVHLIPGKEALTVIFSIGFESKGDQVLSKVFLQEFSEARRMVRGAPAVKFSEREPPLELEQLGVQANPESNISYVSFVLFSHHMDAKNAEHTISYIQTFRNYLHYHLKCSKAYMHARMRKRVDSLLQVLNRARPPPFEPKAKKTAAGKTFTRAGDEGASSGPAAAGGRGRARGAGRAFGRGRG